MGFINQLITGGPHIVGCVFPLISSDIIRYLRGLVVEPYPSEKWWSSSVGMMKFPIYGKIRTCSKPPSRKWFDINWTTGPQKNRNLLLVAISLYLTCIEQSQNSGASNPALVESQKQRSPHRAVSAAPTSPLPQLPTYFHPTAAAYKSATIQIIPKFCDAQ